MNSTVYEFFLGFIYIIIVLVIANIIKKSIKDEGLQKHFFRGFYLKLFGVIFVYIIYFHYYTGGDSITYFDRCQYLRNVFIWDTKNYFKVFYYDLNNIDIALLKILKRVEYTDQSTFTTVKLFSIFSIIGLNGYISTCVVSILFLYIGIWKGLSTLIYFFPNQKNQIALSYLYVPSIIFWGSGIFKDSITFSFIGFVIWAFANIFIHRKHLIVSLITLVSCTYVIGLIKGYIVIALIPSLIIWFFFHYRTSINNQIIKILFTPILIGLILISGYFSINLLSSTFTKFSITNLETKAKGMQRWHTYRVKVMKGGDGSSYSLGDMDFSPRGLLLKIPAALNVTFYRPWLWEVRSPIMILAALESLYMLIISISCLYSIIQNKIKTIQIFNSNPLLIGILCFTLVFGFSVGITSYNFGALSRYRIPLLPFYFTLMLVIKDKLMNTEVIE